MDLCCYEDMPNEDWFESCGELFLSTRFFKLLIVLFNAAANRTLRANEVFCGHNSELGLIITDMVVGRPFRMTGDNFYYDHADDDDDEVTRDEASRNWVAAVEVVEYEEDEELIEEEPVGLSDINRPDDIDYYLNMVDYNDPDEFYKYDIEELGLVENFYRKTNWLTSDEFFSDHVEYMSRGITGDPNVRLVSTGSW